MAESDIATPWTSGTVYGDFVYTDEEMDADVLALNEAMDGLGTNEKDIIKIITKLNNAQRQELIAKYGQSSGDKLIDCLKSELGGDFEDTVVGMMMKPDEYDAKILHDSMSGAGTDENALIGIMCTRNNEQIEMIKAAYKTLYENELADDLDCDTSGHFERLLKSLTFAAREEDDGDDDRAQEDAQVLIDAGVAELGTNEFAFNNILCSRSYPHLRKVFERYEATQERPIEEDLASELSGNLLEGYLAIVKIAKDPIEYYVDRIRNATDCWGTNDSELIRIVVTRAETDLANIKARYQEKYEQSLYDVIDSECSSHYKQCLLSLVEGHYVDI